MSQTETRNKLLGCLYGQAIGDALGFGTEGMTKEEVKKTLPYRPKNLQQHHTGQPTKKLADREMD